MSCSSDSETDRQEKMFYVKGIWYGSDPVVISIQLTDFQSLIGQRMNHSTISYLINQ